MEKEITLKKSWADTVEEEEAEKKVEPIAKAEKKALRADKSYASAVSGNEEPAKVEDKPGDIEPQIRIIEPTVEEIYDALVKANLIRCECPDNFARSQDPIERALYTSQHTNPRGTQCLPSKSTVTLCWQSATGCMYARIIAIILGLTAGSVAREDIEKINVFDFTNMNRELVGRTGNHWFSVYAIYINACEHMIKFNHHCKARCPIANTIGTRKFSRETEKLVCNHMIMYRHPAYDGPPGRPPIPRHMRERRVQDDNRKRNVVPIEEEPPEEEKECPSIIISDVLKHADSDFHRVRRTRK